MNIIKQISIITNLIFVIYLLSLIYSFSFLSLLNIYTLQLFNIENYLIQAWTTSYIVDMKVLNRSSSECENGYLKNSFGEWKPFLFEDNILKSPGCFCLGENESDIYYLEIECEKEILSKSNIECKNINEIYEYNKNDTEYFSSNDYINSFTLYKNDNKRVKITSNDIKICIKYDTKKRDFFNLSNSYYESIAKQLLNKENQAPLPIDMEAITDVILLSKRKYNELSLSEKNNFENNFEMLIIDDDGNNENENILIFIKRLKNDNCYKNFNLELDNNNENSSYIKDTIYNKYIFNTSLHNNPYKINEVYSIFKNDDYYSCCIGKLINKLTFNEEFFSKDDAFGIKSYFPKEKITKSINIINPIRNKVSIENFLIEIPLPSNLFINKIIKGFDFKIKNKDSFFFKSNFFISKYPNILICISISSYTPYQFVNLLSSSKNNTLFIFYLLITIFTINILIYFLYILQLKYIKNSYFIIIVIIITLVSSLLFFSLSIYQYIDNNIINKKVYLLLSCLNNPQSLNLFNFQLFSELSNTLYFLWRNLVLLSIIIILILLLFFINSCYLNKHFVGYYKEKYY